MTREELGAIEAREAAATPGPWEARIWNINWEITYYVSMPNDILKVSSYTLEDHEREDENYRYVNDNAEFIAHARADVPALIAEVKHLTRERDAAVADLQISAKCQTCKDYNPDDGCCYLDYGRGAGEACEHHDNWQWRGVRA